MRIKAWGSRLAVLLVFGLLAAACGSDNNNSSSAGGGNTTGAASTLVVGTTDSLQNSFDPAQAYDLFASTIDFNTAETLVTYKPNAIDPTPLLAAALPTVSADGTVYTFELRSGVKFHDGTPLDSAAVKFSLERARDFGNKDAEAAGFLLTGIKSIATPSPTTVEVTLDKPNVTFLSRLAFTVASIVSPTAYKANVLAGTEDGPAVLTKYKTDTVVGTGPYKLVSYKEKESLTLEANPDYWGDKPKTDKVLIRLFDKSSALKLALQNKEVDVAYRALQPDDLNFFRGQSGFKVVEGQGPGIRYLTFNVTKPPFDNINLRKAVAAAVDRQAVTTEVLKGTGVPLQSMIPPNFSTSYEAKWSELYGSTVDKAKVDQYLTDAGVPAGQKVDLDFWFSPTHYGDTEAAVAQVVARSLTDTGRFNVTISNVEWAEYGNKRRAGEMPVFLMGWYPDYLDVDDYLEPFSDPKVFDPAKWEDPQMLDLVHAQQTQLDSAQRTATIKQAQAYMADQTPYVPIFQITQFAATTDNVSGVVLDPIQLLRFFLIEKA
ncbi:MAG: peptide/nickel transport system substrate-binding protein [Actinomycetota bacterium]|nr:peptide/nickel transport system substrate-binding protein [Actinomycetota bacterium]